MSVEHYQLSLIYQAPGQDECVICEVAGSGSMNELLNEALALLHAQAPSAHERLLAIARFDGCYAQLMRLKSALDAQGQQEAEVQLLARVTLRLSRR